MSELPENLPDNWRGFYVERDEAGDVKSLYRNLVEGIAEEPLAEDHEDVVAAQSRIDTIRSGAGQAATDRQKLLDALVAQAAKDFAADASADPDLKAAALREQERRPALAESSGTISRLTR